MNDTNRTILIVAVAFLLLISFMPWGRMATYGGSGWGWCGMMQKAGYTSSWTFGIVGWIVNIALIVLIALLALWLLRDMDRSEHPVRKKR